MGQRNTASRERIDGPRRGAFTIVELLVVILIIAVLMSILVPVIGKARRAAYAASTKNFLSQLSSAIERYQNDFRAYPGPISNGATYNSNFTTPTVATAPVSGPAITGYDETIDSKYITGPENLVLGLLGGLAPSTSTPGSVVYNPTFVGRGPSSLNTANPKLNAPYIDAIQLSSHTEGGKIVGYYSDEVVTRIKDSNIPEFVDNFPDSMPVLYLRSRVGAQSFTTSTPGYGNDKNSVITNGSLTAIPPRAGSYDISQIIAYTSSYNDAGNLDNAYAAGGAGAPPSDFKYCIGTGKRIPVYTDGTTMSGKPAFAYHGLRTINTNSVGTPPDNNYHYPLDAFPYFQDPANPAQPRKKDSYILISAGVDRIYGTSDDIVSFGTVGE